MKLEQPETDSPPTIGPLAVAPPPHVALAVFFCVAVVLGCLLYAYAFPHPRQPNTPYSSTSETLTPGVPRKP